MSAELQPLFRRALREGSNSIQKVATYVLLLTSAACSPTGGPQTGTQTNWLRVCAADKDCDPSTQCLCQTCTQIPDDDACSDLPEASIVASDEDGAIALCGGSQAAVEELCLIRCDDGTCPRGTSCVAGVCTPARDATLTVSIDRSIRYQSMLGFGAGLGYIQDEIVSHPRKKALFDAMFKSSGFEILRLRNQYVQDGSNDLSSIVEIVEAASDRIGHRPTVMLSSSSPPANLKENGATYCSGNPDECTLNRADDGGFNYAGLAEHFVGSLEAYSSEGITVDYLSIQNNPNWVPPTGTSIESCLFLPHEGMTTVVVDGREVEVELPGYSEALNAVLEAIEDLPSQPKIAGPETTGAKSSVDYVSELDLKNLDALAHHLYGIDPFNPLTDALQALARAGQENDIPLLQSEMAGDGLETALLAQESLVDSQSSMYLQTGFVAPAGLAEPDEKALIGLSDTDFVLQDPYYALKHFAQNIKNGWSRVEAQLDRDSVRVSAWISPDGEDLAIVLVNPQTVEEVVELDMDDLAEMEIARTVFTGVERFADLGMLAPGDTFTLPASSMVTLYFKK